MTDTPPARVTFTPHAADYYTSTNSVPWQLQESLSQGSTVATSSHSTHVYTPGSSIERVIGSVITDLADANFIAIVQAPQAVLTADWQWGPAINQSWVTTQVDFDAHAGVGFWSDNRYSDNLFIAWQRQTSDVTLSATADIWWSNLVVFHKRFDYAGGLIDTVTNPALTAQGVVEDLMGRGLDRLVEYNPNRVDPDTPWTGLVPHAAWWDGVSALEVLDFAITYAPQMWWQATVPGNASGLPVFDVGRWDGPPRYIFAPGQDGLQLSGGAADLANRALVRYVGATFQQVKTVWVAEVTAPIATLVNAGLTRTMIVDVTGEGLMTTQDARLRGMAALQQASLSKTTGSITVSAPVYDRIEGRMVEPWEIEPGCTVVVCDAPLSFGRSTSLTESAGSDGVCVFRARAVSYDAGQDAATIDLDGGYRSLLGRIKSSARPRRYDVAQVRS